MKSDKKRGQPLKAADKKSSELVSLYLTPKEKAMLMEFADAEMLSVSKLIRKKLKECEVI